MLKQRLLAAAVLIPLVIMAILLLPSIGFIALLTVVVLMAIWEWLSMAAIKPMFKVLASISFVAVLAVLLTTAAIDHILFSGLLFWILFSLLIVLFAHRPLPGILAGCFHNKVFTYLLSMLVTLLFVYSAVWLHGFICFDKCMAGRYRWIFRR